MKKIAINDVFKTEFPIVCLCLAGEMIQNIDKRKGYDMNENNYHLFHEDEKYVIDAFYILMDIQKCLTAIDASCIFMKRFYGKEYYKQHDINIVNYLLYHYDVFCHKNSTLRDLYFKLINQVYSLGLGNRGCNWKGIEKHENEIANPVLFRLLRDNYDYMKILEDTRNKSSHEGHIDHHAFKDIEPLVMLSTLSERMPELGMKIQKGSLFDWRLKESRKNFMKEMDIHRHNAFTFTKCIVCSLSEKFADTLSDEIKSNYATTIEEAILVLDKKEDNCSSCG